MAKRELTDEEKKILERIGSSETAQRSKQIAEMYRKKDEADKAYADAQKKTSGFAGSGLDLDKNYTGGTANADLLKKKKEADAAVAAFEQSNAERNFRQRASRLTMQQFEKEFADIERRKQDLEESKGSFREALKPGGVTPSEWNKSRKEKNAQIKALENEEDKYRAIRDDKKSHYETDMLPDDVKALLDGYNAVDISDEGIDLKNMFLPAEQKSHTRINSQKLKNEQKRREIADELVKRGYDNYKELAEYRKYITESETTDKIAEEMGEFTEAHPIASTAANVALMPARLLTGAMGTLKGVTDNKETDLGSNPKLIYYALTRANKEKRETIGESFEDGLLSANTKKFLYETADSALESLAAGAMFGPAGGAMLGLGAMNESVIESLESGRTSTEALVNGIAAGTFEMLFEKLSLGEIKALKNVPVKTIKDVVKNIGHSVVVNFSEEANTEIANLIFDSLYNGGTSQYYEAVTALIGQGYSEKEARSRVIKDMAKQVGLAGLGGALMGSAFGAYGSAAGAVNYNSQLQDTGRQIVDYDNAETLVAGAKDVQGNDKLRQLAEEIVFTERAQQKAELEGKIADLEVEIKRLNETKGKGSGEKLREKQKELRNLKKEAESLYTKKDYRNVGKASELLAEQTSADRTDAVKKAVSERLKKVGEDNSVVADAIVKKATGKTLTKKEQKAYSSSKKALQVYRELTGYIYDAEWSRNLKKDIDALYDRRYNPEIEKTVPTAPAGETDNKTRTKVVNITETKKYEQQVENIKNLYKEKLYREGQDKAVLSAAVDLCFDYGRSGNYTLRDAVESKHISDSITPEQRKHAYEVGVYQGLKDTVNVRYKGDTVSVFVNGFKGKVDKNSVKSYASAFDTFYSEGIHTAKSFDAVLKANGDLFSYIGKNVAEKAFEQGRKLSEKQNKAPAVSRRKPAGKGEYKSKILDEKEFDVFFERLADKLGVNITREMSIEYEGRKANAYVDINNGEVVSSASSDNEYQSSIHETVHIAYAYNAEKMRTVAKAVKEYFLSKHSAVKLEETLRAYGQNYKSSIADAEEEFVADCLAGMFSTDEGVNDFIAWLEKESGYSTEKKKTVLQEFIDWLTDVVEVIKELVQGRSLNGVAAEFAKEETARFKEIRQMFLEALDEVAEGTVGRETKNTAESGVKYSFKNSKTGMANDKLMPYDDELIATIKAKGGYIVDSFEKLKDVVNIAFDNPNLKATVYFGVLSSDVLEKIEKSIPNLPKELKDGLFKANQTYSVAATLDSIQHLADEKNLTKEDIVDYLDRMADTIIDFDTVNFNYYVRGNLKSNGIIFRKSFKDGTMQSFEIVSNKKRSLNLQTIYMEKGDYIKKKSAKALLMDKPSANVQDAGWSNSNIIINNSSENVKTSLDWVEFAEKQEKERSAVSKVTELEKIVDELRAKIQHPGVKHIVNTAAVQKVARSLKSEYMSKINVHVLSDELGTLYSYLANENGLNWDNLQIHLENIATKILDESKFKNPDISDYAKGVLRDVRSVKIKLNDRQKAAVAEKYGSYNEFRKRMMGTIILSEEGMSLDKRWGELSEAYPIFDSSVADADQPLEMVEVVAALRSTYEDMHGMDYDSAKEMLMAEIYEQYFEVPETKYISEEYALKLARAKADYGERLKEAKAEFRSQREEAYKKAKAEYAVALKGIREEQQEEIIKAKARYNLRVQNIADTRTKEKKRNNIIRNVKRLDKLLRNPGKGAPSAGTNKYGKDYVHLTNIPQEFRKAVIDFCSIFIENDAGVFSGVVKSDNVTVREKKVEHLQKIYAMMQNSESYLKETVAEEMQERIDTVAKIMAERRLAQLSIEELDKVIEITEYLTASINSQVAVWVEGKKSTVEKKGKAAIAEFNKMGRHTYLGGKLYDLVKEFGVNNYKPVYFFERVGGVLEKLFLTIQNDGQRAYARNINAAAAFMEGLSKKYNYQKWQKEKELVLTTKQGHKLKLTKAQAMHIWATAERERIAGKDAMHLMQGGIVFDGEIKADTIETTEEEREADIKAGRKPKKEKLSGKVFKYKTQDGSAHRIHFEDVMKISEYLTAEQKAFVNECIRYLSVDMAALGNEISMELYGIKRFQEQYYIPYNSAKNFIYRKMGENGNAMLKNKSFTKETVFSANNPLVVGDFLEVIAQHIEEMSMYNAMVLPLENFNRVWNYQTIAPEDDEKTSRQSVKSAMQTAYGKEYVDYVDQLLEDINGGIKSDAREKALVKLTSGFKKAAVLGSASVVIQQPSAVVRAFAEIDPKYFVATTFTGRKKAWENALKYSSTALLKDIGGFDTVSGQSTVDYLTKEEYKGKDRVLKLFTDSQYRDDILSWGPGFADKVTWAHIWAACEREVRSIGYNGKKGLTGEALNEAVGKRFDEVINKTQVYDSVLTRSANMRSKSSFLKMATSFKAEPTTQANMLASAAFDFKNKKFKQGARKVSSVVLSQLFNAVLVSIVYGARDDEDDETLVEKYISEVVNNFLSSLNPLTLIPVYSDIVSIFEGYDVKRTDMSLISKIADAIKALKSTTKTRGEKISLIAGSVADALGFPLTNLIRDGKAVYNVAKNIKGVKDTTGKGVLYAIQDDILPIHQNMKLYKPDSKDERLYYAFRDNDEKMYNRFAAQYKTGSEIKNALKGQIEDGFLEEKLTDEEAMTQLRRLGFSENEAYYEVRKLKEPVAEEESEDNNSAFKSFNEMQNIQSEADAQLEAERQQASEGGKTYSEDADYTWLRDRLKAGDKEGIDEEIDLLTEKGVSEDKISSEVKKWLKENDSDVISQAEQSLKGNYASYESKVKSIADKYGIDESTAAAAVRSAAGSTSDPVEGTVYALGDLHFAMESGSEQTISDISGKLFNAKLQNKRNEGEDYDKARSYVKNGMRTSVKSKWKEAYQNAKTSTEMARIRSKLWFTGLWDNTYELDDMLREWREEIE